MDISQADALFLEHYQLQYDPFAERGPKFQFYKAKRRAVLKQLIHFARYGSLLLLVTGPKGSGKTVLRHAMVAAGNETTVNIVVSALQAQDAGALIQHIAYGLQSEQRDVMGLLQAVEQLSITGSDVHILIDDADALQESAILLLQRLAKGNGIARAAVFLFGEPSLQNLLEDVSADGEEIEHHLIELEPWSATDMRGYLQARLEAVGQSIELFTVQDLDTLYRESAGWPGAINQLAKEILLKRIFEQPKRRINFTIPYRYLLALLVITFLFILVLYQQDDMPNEQQVMSEVPAVEKTGMSASPREPLPEAETERLPLELPMEVPEEPQLHPVIASDDEVTQITEPVMAAVVIEESVSEQAMQPSQPELEAEKPEPPIKVTTKPAPAQKPVVSDTNRSEVQKQNAASGKATWYTQQSGQKFTLQILATSNAQAAQKFVQHHGAQYNYFRKHHQGKTLYVVTHGSFGSRDAAIAAERVLPEEIRKNKPWVRTFGSIQQELR